MYLPIGLAKRASGLPLCTVPLGAAHVPCVDPRHFWGDVDVLQALEPSLYLLMVPFHPTRRHPFVLDTCPRHGLLCFGDVLGLHALPALGYLVGHLLTLFEGLEPSTFNVGVVDENVPAPVVRGDEAVAFPAIAGPTQHHPGRAG